VIVERVKSETSPSRGYDAESMEYVDMLKAGIIDPTTGGARGAAERGVGCIAAVDDRGAGHGSAGGEAGGAADAARRLLRLFKMKRPS
jgi:hypothetical protein